MKEEHAKLVAADKKQSPIGLDSASTSYTIWKNKPLSFEYPKQIENLRLTNTGYAWQVKIPYQISMNSTLHGPMFQLNHRYKLDQFHCHWGATDSVGSEHTVDGKYYSAELHFVHYNMEKYFSISSAARKPDGLVVVAVFIDAQENYQAHNELEKIVSRLRDIPFKNDHTIIHHGVKLENLLPANKSYWSYSGSLTTPPYFESVQWFVFKNPIKCNKLQTLDRFRQITSSQRSDQYHNPIESNYRGIQALNGRTVASFDCD